MRTLQLTAVLLDGSANALSVPRRASLPLNVEHKQLTTLRYRVITSNNVPVSLPASDPSTQAVFSIRKDRSSLPSLRITGAKRADLGRNIVDFVLASTVWARITSRMWRYDVWLVRGEEQDLIVPYSYFHVGPGMGTGPMAPDPPMPCCGFDFGES